MKKIKFNSKLKLNKKTVSRLNDSESENIKGGGRVISKDACPTRELYCDTDNFGCSKD